MERERVLGAKGIVVSTRNKLSLMQSVPSWHCIKRLSSNFGKSVFFFLTGASSFALDEILHLHPNFFTTFIFSSSNRQMN